MSSTQDSASRNLVSDPQSKETKLSTDQMQAWTHSLSTLMDAVEKSAMEPERKSEILMHMAVIRAELERGNLPSGEDHGAVRQLTDEVGELEKIAQDWQVLSLKIASWVKAISDSLGVR